MNESNRDYKHPDVCTPQKVYRCDRDNEVVM